MALSGDGKYLAIVSGFNDREVSLWKWETEEPRRLESPGGGVTSFSFSPDDKLLVGVQDFGSVYAWEVPSGRLLYQRKSSHKDFFFCGKPAFSSDGKTLASALRHNTFYERGKIQLLNPLTGLPQGVLSCNGVLEVNRWGGGLAISPDARIVAANAGQGMRFWDLASRQELPANDAAHESAPRNIMVTEKGLLVSAGDDGTARIWDAATTKQLRKFAAAPRVRAIDLSPDGLMLGASSLDGAVHVWESSTGKEIHRLPGHGSQGGRRALAFLSDGLGLLSWGDDFHLRLWDVATGKSRGEFSIRPNGINVPDTAKPASFDFLHALGNASITPNGKILVLEIGKFFYLFDTGTGEQRFQFPSEGGRGTSMAVSANSKYLLASGLGSKQFPVSLLDLSTGTGVKRWLLPGYQTGSMAFSPSGRMFAIATRGDQDEILVYDAASCDLRRSIRGFRGQVRSLAFFPDGRRLASGLSDSTVVIWDLTSPEHMLKSP
jgi:WD40 repeat protein